MWRALPSAIGGTARSYLHFWVGGVVAKTQDPLWREREGYVHVKGRKRTEGGGRFPEGVVGPQGPAFTSGWVRPDGGGAEDSR